VLAHPEHYDIVCQGAVSIPFFFLCIRFSGSPYGDDGAREVGDYSIAE